MKKNISSRPFYKAYYYWFIIDKKDSRIMLASAPKGPEPQVLDKMPKGIEKWLVDLNNMGKPDFPPVIFEKNERWISVKTLSTDDSISRVTTIVETFQNEKSD
jgi:hypothetical protein